MEEQLRPMTDYERAIIERLLAPEFKGRDEAVQQISDCLVRVVDETGSLGIWTNVDIDAPVETLIPVEAEVADEDGDYIYYTLQFYEGKVIALEMLKMGDLPVLKQPDPKELKIFVNRKNEKGKVRQYPG